MRFTSIVNFMKFVQFLEGLGYMYPGPLYDLTTILRGLPDFISMYQVVLDHTYEYIHITLYRNNKVALQINMENKNEA